MCIFTSSNTHVENDAQGFPESKMWRWELLTKSLSLVGVLQVLCYCLFAEKCRNLNTVAICVQFSKFLKCRVWCWWLCVPAQSWLDEKLTWTEKMVTAMLVTKRTTHKSFSRDLKGKNKAFCFLDFCLLATGVKLKNMLQHKHNKSSLQYCTAS